VFVLGNDAEVIPGWLATGEHFSVSLTFTDLSEQEAEVTIDFVNRELLADNLHEKAVFLVMAGSPAHSRGSDHCNALGSLTRPPGLLQARLCWRRLEDAVQDE